MTDFTKGIIDICGYEITTTTTPEDIEKNLNGKWCSYNITTDKVGKFIRFKNIELYGKNIYKIKLYFYNNNLKEIDFSINYDEAKCVKDYFECDCRWLKSILGEPTKKGATFVDYIYSNFYISAYYVECNGRQGEDNKLVMRFERV